MEENSPSKKIKIILAGSGALYPIYIGALLAIEHNNFVISKLSGTSGGAIACSLWSLSDVAHNEQDLTEFLIRTLPINFPNINISEHDFSLWRFFKDRYFANGDFLETMFKEVFPLGMKNAKIPLTIYLTDNERKNVHTFSSHRDHIHNEQFGKILQASCSIPLVFPASEIGGKKYVDGGWSCHFPTVEVEDNEVDEVWGIRIGESGDSWVEKKIYDYFYRILYKDVHQQMIVDGQKHQNFRILSLNSCHKRSNLLRTKEQDVISMFKEGYEQAFNFSSQILS